MHYHAYRKRIQVSRLRNIGKSSSFMKQEWKANVRKCLGSNVRQSLNEMNRNR